MTSLRSRCARALTLLLTGALLVVSGGNLLICIEADGRIHLESGAELCCDQDAATAQADKSLGALTGVGDDCGSCRDVLAGSAPARQAASASASLPVFDVYAGPDCLDAASHALALPANDPPSLTLASLQTIIIRC